jgi:ribosomal protein L24
MICVSYDRLMADKPKFDHGDDVQVTGGEHKGRMGSIVSINVSSPSGTYTVEFGIGSDAEIKEELLSTVKRQSRPVTVENVKEILRDDLAECDEEQVATFKLNNYRKISISPIGRVARSRYGSRWQRPLAAAAGA